MKTTTYDAIVIGTGVASAYAARMAARAAEYGVDVGSVRVDMKRVTARKDAVSKQSRTGPIFPVRDGFFRVAR